MRIATSSEMKQIERNGNLMGISYYDMMENAGKHAFDFIKQTCDIYHLHFLIAVGTGNNGGDGLVCARLLKTSGADVTIIFVGGYPKTQDSIKNMELAHSLGIDAISPADHLEQIKAIDSADIIIEAVYGTGFHGKFRDENVRILMKKFNSSEKIIFSLDIPGGIDSDNGCFDEDAVSANYTIAFDSLKPAHLVYPSADKCGSVHCFDIGIPDKAHTGVKETFKVITNEIVFDSIPTRGTDTNKGTFGKLLNISSCRDMTGAGRLSSLGAHRVGTGLVTLAAPDIVIGIHETVLTETVFMPLKSNKDGTVSSDCISEIEKNLKNYSACIIGCGLGCNEDTKKVVSAIISHDDIPMLVDADGINSICNDVSILRHTSFPVVLTPHPAEMARLCHCSTEEVLKNKIELGKKFSCDHNAVLVLKGAHTLVFTPDGMIYINLTGNNGLAKGGSGDILSGMISGFLAQGISPVMSAVCGVYLHGLAADKCAERLSKTAMLPSDIFKDLCEIFLKNGR